MGLGVGLCEVFVGGDDDDYDDDGDWVLWGFCCGFDFLGGYVEGMGGDAFILCVCVCVYVLSGIDCMITRGRVLVGMYPRTLIS